MCNSVKTAYGQSVILTKSADRLSVIRSVHHSAHPSFGSSVIREIRHSVHSLSRPSIIRIIWYLSHPSFGPTVIDSLLFIRAVHLRFTRHPVIPSFDSFLNLSYFHSASSSFGLSVICHLVRPSFGHSVIHPILDLS